MSLQKTKEFLQKYHVLLATASPRRHEIFSYLEIPFETWASHAEEKPNTEKDVFSQVDEIARLKGEKAKNKYPQSLIISADTEVILNGHLFGKPNSYQEAYSMLLELSEKTHIVATSVAIFLPDKEAYVFQERTLVTFAKILAYDLEKYLLQKEYQDKAGGYAIQNAFGACHIKKIDGCFFNVMGFPLHRFCQEIGRLAELLF